jgi:hypothetical protein
MNDQLRFKEREGAVMILPVVANYGISNCLVKCGLIFEKHVEVLNG